MNMRKIFAKAIENWPVKILSIGLAIILFVFHRMSTLEERFFSVPLTVENVGALMPSSSFPRMIRVGLKGEANSIFPILEDDIEVYVDMNNFNNPGNFKVPVQWRKKGTALGVEPLQISVDPVELSLSLDHKISKFVPITASLRGQVEMGHTMTSYSLNPAQVIIDGPAGLMVGISELYTDNVDLDGRKDDFSLTVNILNRDPLIVIRGNGTAEFRGHISQIIPVRNIGNVPIAVTGLMEGFTGELETTTGSIHLEGENQETVNRFEPPPDFLKVDCSGINEPGIYVLRVISGTAGGISFRTEPDEVTIEIRSAAEEE
jgi:YbbR domain-containing protein